MGSKRGFAAMTPEKRREIGGKAAHQKGTAHEFTGEEAVRAGQAGGQRLLERRGSEHMAAIGRVGGAKVSRDKEYMREIGRKGGEAVSGDREHMAAMGMKSAAARKAARAAADQLAAEMQESGAT